MCVMMSLCAPVSLYIILSLRTCHIVNDRVILCIIVTICFMATLYVIVTLCFMVTLCTILTPDDAVLHDMPFSWHHIVMICIMLSLSDTSDYVLPT